MVEPRGGSEPLKASLYHVFIICIAKPKRIPKPKPVPKPKTTFLWHSRSKCKVGENAVLGLSIPELVKNPLT